MPKLPALVLIDIQEGFHDPYWGNRNNPAFEKNAGQLLRFARENSFPIYHVRHHSTEMNSPLRPDRAGVKFMHFIEPRANEPLITKQVNSAFIGTDLEAQLKTAGLTHLILAGLTSDHCVSTTARMAKNLGFEVTVSSDATATFDRYSAEGTRFEAELVHHVSLASLNSEFATVSSTTQIITSSY